MSAVINESLDGLRMMQESDLDQVAEIENSIYPFPWTKGIFNDCLLVGYSCWVIQEEGKIIAYSILSTGANEGHLLTIVVAPGAQGQGYGRRMMEHIINIARERKAETVYLEVRPSNERAIKLYQLMGFNEIGTRPNYYPAVNGREDALVMAISLTSS